MSYIKIKKYENIKKIEKSHHIWFYSLYQIKSLKSQVFLWLVTTVLSYLKKYLIWNESNAYISKLLAWKRFF